tara:strand:+ start:106 stop:414 length:309 start_codon:yes stop_codon:yes gene_type:complete
MRLFYKQGDIEVDGVSKPSNKAIEVTDEAQIKFSLSEAQALVDSGDAILYDTHDKLDEVRSYRYKRELEYPSIESQLDRMYHDGFDAWKASIKVVKDKHPKP